MKRMMVDSVRIKIGIIVLLSLFLISCASSPTATPLPRATIIAQRVPTATPVHLMTSGTQAIPTTQNQPTVAPVAETHPKETPTDDPTPVVAQAALVVESTIVKGSEPTRVDVVLSDIVNLYGVEIHLAYDPSLVEIVDADPDMPGVQITPGRDFGGGTGFIALNRVDITEGTIDFAATRLNPAPPLYGRAVVASFALRPVKAGTMDVAFSQALLADRNGNPMRVGDRGTNLTVQP